MGVHGLLHNHQVFTPHTHTSPFPGVCVLCLQAVSRRLSVLAGEVASAKQRAKMGARGAGGEGPATATPGNTGGYGSIEHAIRVSLGVSVGRGRAKDGWSQACVHAHLLCLSCWGVGQVDWGEGNGWAGAACVLYMCWSCTSVYVYCCRGGVVTCRPPWPPLPSSCSRAC